MERLKRVGRGALRRCPRCGHRDVFTGYFSLRHHCPSCGFLFEREEGYWVGAMIVNIAVTEAAFAAVFLGGMLATWPDVPWTALLVAGLVVNGLLPIVFYPLSKTIWLGVDLYFNPPTVAEEATAETQRQVPDEDG